MGVRFFRSALRHRGAVTVTLVAVLLSNLLFVGYLDPPDLLDNQLPMAAQCQGGGPGCAEQPLIPPPAGGLPHFDAPPDPVFGALVLVEPAPPVSVIEPPPLRIEHPPALTVA
jgi:hypothetical protein